MSTFEAQLATHYPDSLIDAQSYWQPGTEEPGSALNISPLLHYDFLRLDGPDSRKFLQGQTSCDWQQITAEQASRGAYCNLKGRVVSSFVGAMPSEDCALLRMSADLCESTRLLLNKYIVFSKASISETRRQHHVIALWGDDAQSKISAVFGKCPQGELSGVVTAPDTVVIQSDHDGKRFECWLSDERACELWPALSEGASVVPGGRWEAENIRAGIADVCAATQDMFVPQQLNYQLTGALNFKKGCYTGQEVVARMQYRGKLKRRLYAATVNRDTPATPGSELFADDEASSIGNVVSMYSENGQALVSAVLSINALDKAIHLAGETQPLSLLKLPYPLPEIGED
ncbi:MULTISPECIES: YgfZ/GcvT domain-containing protein [Spongiibacter]|uniref:CAF17-like 4Fe-4S cluster assembly/insertion protein YgfZ n=1 Tax=Spongiibacter TaxID=630749 RepID=UPI002355D292|nr:MULTISPECIES: hypothetical protein [Spongiibacter]